MQETLWNRSSEHICLRNEGRLLVKALVSQNLKESFFTCFVLKYTSYQVMVDTFRILLKLRRLCIIIHLLHNITNSLPCYAQNAEAVYDDGFFFKVEPRIMYGEFNLPPA